MRRKSREVACLLEGRPPGDVLNREVLAAAREDGVFLMLADRLRWDEFTGELRAAAVVEALRARELRAMLEALDVTGVRPILIKGAALAYTHYERPELRPRSDVDLVIPGEARTAVARTFTSAGYRRPPEIDGDVAIGQFHFSRTDEHSCTHAFDVHWRVSNVRAFADALSYEELSCDAAALPALGERARSASPVHSLFIACMHRIAHHGDTPNLLWLYDVHLIGRSLTAEMRHAFALLAAAKQMRAVCARSLSLAQNAFGGLDERWIESVRPPASAQEPSAAFVGGGLRQIDILKSDLVETVWPARLQLLREHLFPSAAYMRQRFPRWPTLLLPVAYACRIVRGAPRWLRR